MSASDWIALTALAASIYSIYLGLSNDRHTRHLEAAEKRGQVVLLMTALSVRLGNSERWLSLALIEHSLPEGIIGRVKNLVSALQSMQGQIVGQIQKVRNAKKANGVNIQDLSAFVASAEMRAQDLEVQVAELKESLGREEKPNISFKAEGPDGSRA